MALPGSLYIYQGEELGLPEVDVPVQARQDPMYFRSGGTNPGRDGCRVPLPWSGTHPPFGFSPDDATHQPWLDQPDDWAQFSVAAEVGDPASMLTLYRAGLALRREQPALADGPLRWLPSDPAVLAFTRGTDFGCLVNLGMTSIELPENATLLIASGDLDAGRLPADTAAWVRLDPNGENDR
jgi:alpha-glucosidase